jgi:hypothetical protein
MIKMKTEEIHKAVEEAERFIKTAKMYLEAKKKTYKQGDYTFHHSAPKESGATRRASLDLTRQLAVMRKP